MSIATGAWLSAFAGFVTGWIAPRLRARGPASPAGVVPALLGALLATLAYGVFLAAGFVMSLLLFSSPPDGGIALLGTVAGCILFLAFAWLRSVLAPHDPPWPSREAVRQRGLDSVLDARPVGGPVKMWLAGVVLAALPVAYGFQCLWTGTGTFGTTLWRTTIEGGPAIALGLGWIGVGAFLHFHFFFGLHPRLVAASRRAKLVAMIVAGAGLSIAAMWSVVVETKAVTAAGF